MSLSPEGCATLAQKYVVLGELRRARSRGDAVPARDVFRKLARQFPGCLNELDTLPLDEIDARAAALTEAAEHGRVEPWMVWVSDYHRLLRAAFALKPRLRRRRELSADEVEALAEQASRGVDLPIDRDFVRMLTALPNGRVVPIVLERLAALHDAPLEAIRQTIFARRR